MDIFHPQIAAFILRVVLGMTLIYFGYMKVKGEGSSTGSNSVTYGYIEILIAIFLVVGLFTQLAALLNAVILFIKLGIKVNQGKLFSDGINYYILLFAMALALMFLGSGILAFDSLA